MVSVDPSAVAYASILNVLAGMSEKLFPRKDRRNFLEEIEECTGLCADSDSMKKSQDKLWSLYRHSSQYKTFDSKRIKASGVSHLQPSQLTSSSQKNMSYSCSRNRTKTIDESPTCVSSNE